MDFHSFGLRAESEFLSLTLRSGCTDYGLDGDLLVLSVPITLGNKWDGLLGSLSVLTGIHFVRMHQCCALTP